MQPNKPAAIFWPFLLWLNVLRIGDVAGLEVLSC
jgi:hypothetical protein